MALTRTKKTEIIEKLMKILATAQSVVFVNFHGLKVSDTARLRRELRKENVGYTVAKKTLLRRAINDLPEFEGEVAIAYSADQLAGPRKMSEFVKEFKDRLKILGGIFQGKLIDAVAMREIGSIPEIKTLRGMLVNIINSPIQGLVIALKEYGRAKS